MSRLSVILQIPHRRTFPVDRRCGIAMSLLLITSSVMTICLACTSSTAPEGTMGGEYTSSETDTGIPYSEIRQNYVSVEEGEWETYKESLIGTEIQWTGQVYKVEGAANNMWIKVDMDPDTSWDVMFQIPSKIAFKLKSQKRVRFKAEIDDIRETTVAGEPSVKVWLKNAEVIE